LRRDRRAYAGHRLDRKSPADERHALVHADETERTRTRCLGIASLPVVLDGHDRKSLLPHERDADMARARMFDVFMSASWAMRENAVSASGGSRSSFSGVCVSRSTSGGCAKGSSMRICRTACVKRAGDRLRR
jgi:hypothetical protein